ncbi:MAG TPA: HAD family hydrolase [Stellaceae bacterium]|nr:HAD family hydrolase [Stellaceae bacterium]
MTARPQAILFDWDNTLVDSWLVIHDALVVTFEAMGQQPWTLAETKLRVRHSLREAFPRLFGERWDEARKLYLDTFASIHLERLTTIPGADALLAALSAEGYYLAVVSNKTGRLLRREVEHLGWQPHFRRCVGAGDAAADKPDPAPVHLALEGSGIAPTASWFVGDTELDVDCALASGCVPVLLGAREEIAGALAKAPSTLHFSDCAALLTGLGHL